MVPLSYVFTASLALVLSGTLVACQSSPSAHSVPQGHSRAHAAASPHASPADPDMGYNTPKALKLSAISDLKSIVPELAAKDVVFVGETHTRYDHHLNQLAIIEGLYSHNPNLAIGMEFFQQPFQPYIDDYIAGRIDEKAFLRDTEYYQRWRFDYRLYKPILDFAREKNIPVIALNVPQEITTKVGREGLESLTTEERKQIPQGMDSANEDYRQRLEAVYASHPHTGGSRFDNFLAVQLLWDEGMAERAARYLAQHPNRQLVVLAGSGHLEYGMGIPERLSRRRDVETVIVLQDLHGELEPERADFLLLPQEQRLPPAGMLGAALDSVERGVEVMSFSEDSAAQAAGIQEGDLILALNGEPVKRFADVKLALWDKKPGELVTVRILRSRWLLGDQELEVNVGLR